MANSLIAKLDLNDPNFDIEALINSVMGDKA